MSDFATWNPVDKGANVVLSGGDLIASSSGTPFNTVRATQGKSAGKWYFEVTATAGTFLIMGFGTAAMNLGPAQAFPGWDATDISWGWLFSSGQRWNQGGSPPPSIDFLNVGDIGRLKVDLDAGIIKAAKNGGAFHATDLNATSTLGKTIFPAIGVFDATTILTANFGASAFVYSVPVGYNAGWFEDGVAAGRRRRMLIGRK